MGIWHVKKLVGSRLALPIFSLQNMPLYPSLFQVEIYRPEVESRHRPDRPLEWPLKPQHGREFDVINQTNAVRRIAGVMGVATELIDRATGVPNWNRNWTTGIDGMIWRFIKQRGRGQLRSAYLATAICAGDHDVIAKARCITEQVYAESGYHAVVCQL